MSVIWSFFGLFAVYGVLCFFNQKTAYEMRISDWSSDVCSSDLDLSAVRAEIVELLSKILPQCINHIPCALDHGLLLWAGNHSAGEFHHRAVDRCAPLIGRPVSPTMPVRQAAVVSGLRLPAETIVVSLDHRSEEHTSELQSLMRISYAV